MSCRRLLCCARRWSPALRLGVVALAWLALAAAGVRGATAGEKPFNVASGDAATTLRQFAAQSGEQIVYLVDNVRGEQTNAVSGQLTPRVALERMLAGTRLTASHDPGTGALVVGRRETRPRPPEPPPVTPVAADRVTPPRVTAPPADPIITLSPFEVRAEEDKGYQATNTLAGTRLRSELKDLAASISVVTREFMNDVNATDLTSLLVYTLGTEVGGFGGNFSDLSNPEAQGVFDDALGQASPGTRIRGLIHADRTRNYFLTDVPLDSYNIDRVEISRGASANLFGLGSPAGVINSTLIKADTRRTGTTVSGSLGSWGSYRGTLDHNQVFFRD